MKRSVIHTVLAAFLAVAVVLTLTAPAAVAASLVEYVNTMAMEADRCEPTPEPCCCEAHSKSATEQTMSGMGHPADKSAPGSMPACGCSLSSSEPAPIVPAAVPAHGASPVVIAAHGLVSTSDIAPLRTGALATKRGPAPAHEGIYLFHCALLR
ncbi:MAG: hypothetical protein IIB38_10155 [Candidatus Hydrogenedentes bacterium]|nr:hypothetical protein [Candidatus Hydrogenedentota bacterium]